ncbi:MAG: hypothetical protein D6734_06000 [Candidatus Schekmanbacteria bacterium]|nr:MAG: hypothetical protein D6734_06000 [Candidatus Schekmanbacteria bacterium]
MLTNQYREEMLQLIEAISDNGYAKIEELKRYFGEKAIDELISNLKELEMIGLNGEGNLYLTEKGKLEASNIIRRHRLAERLLHDVLGVEDEAAAEKHACDFEHILDKEVTDNICTLLGHPKFCPDGKPIPPGECCIKNKYKVESIIKSLNSLDVGERGRIAYMFSEDHSRIDKLASMGLMPGTIVKVHQKQPSLVVCFDETTIAMDDEIAQDIYVKKC